MPSTPSTVGSYTIEREIGRGGMGVVYLAHDSRLERRVALKALPPEFAADPERLARFAREAKLLASLNHPNIAAIHGLEEADGARYLVLEYVDGETLAERIARGPLPLDDALDVAAQIAAALEAAHDAGVVHRDLKPGNVVLTSADRVKVLDFGLAKAVEGDGSAANLTNSPTMSALATQRGVILGTAAYMSPEQARGRHVDRRADVWAFGCVLFEMLTGRQAFSGDTVTDTLAAVLRSNVDWSALPVETPRALRRLLERCLAKDPAQRFRDMGDVRLLLEEVRAPGAAADDSVAPAATRPRGKLRSMLPWALAAAALTIALVLALAASLSRRPGTLHVAIAVDSPGYTGDFPFGPWFAISPDGSRIVYVRRRNHSLMLRALSDAEPRLLEGTDDANAPFFSPDGQWIGFFTETKLKKIAVTGGAPVVLGDVDGYGRGASWSGHSIVFAPAPAGGLYRMSENGGAPVRITTPDAAKGEVSHRYPQVLPGGKTVVYTVKSADITSFDDARLAAAPLRSGREQIILQGGYMARSAPGGRLVYCREGALYAVRFDARRLKTAGTPIPVVQDALGYGVSGAACFDISPDGTLVYAGGLPKMPFEMRLVERGGGSRLLLSEEQNSVYGPRVSPDGTRVAFTIGAANDKMWWCNLTDGTASPLTTGPGNDEFPVWSRDGTRVAFASDRPGVNNLYVVPSDGSAPAARLHANTVPEFPSDWSADGSTIAFTEVNPATKGDIWMLSLPGHRARPFLATPANEWGGVFSPDGRWLAYASDETGRTEIYVRAVAVSAARVQVSRRGATPFIGPFGAAASWPPRSSEMFYARGDTMFAVPITAGQQVRAGPARVAITGIRGPGCDPFPDGRRFALVATDTSRLAGPAALNVVLGWRSELAHVMRRARR